MTDLRRATRLTMLAAGAALIFAACGSSASSATPSSSAEAPAPPSVQAPSVAPSEAPAASEAPSSAATAAPTLGPLPNVDLAALNGIIPGVNSYRTSMTVGGVNQCESTVMEQPVVSKAITVFDGGTISTRYVIIGQEAWSADGANGKFASIPSAEATTLLMACNPALLLGPFLALDWAHIASDQGMEQKNGIQARHVRVDPSTPLGAGVTMPAGSAIDAWVADAGYIVAWEMSGFGQDANFAIEVTNVDDPANKVDRPS
jgi:hypothetical protein